MKDNLEGLEKEFLETFLSGIETGKDVKESMNKIFQKILTEAIKEVDKEKNIDKERLKEELIIGNRSFVKFIEISEEGKRPIIYIDKSKIVSVIEFNGVVAIRMDVPEYSIYKIEGSLEEVLNKLQDKVVRAED